MQTNKAKHLKTCKDFGKIVFFFVERLGISQMNIQEVLEYITKEELCSQVPRHHSGKVKTAFCYFLVEKPGFKAQL